MKIYTAEGEILGFETAWEDCVEVKWVVEAAQLPDNWAMKARVKVPKYPDAGVMPFAPWYLARACCVFRPKYVDSLPGEPLPVVAMVKP